jgi:spore germination protein YaaH
VNNTIRKFLALATFSSVLLPNLAAAAGLKYSAWLPFWKKWEGAKDFALQMEKFSSISPFSYEVNPNGTLKDPMKLGNGSMDNWIDAVKDGGVKVIPTIALLDGDAVHALLSNKKLRIKHEDIIAKLVKDNDFDGIDIDYEDKWAKTREYFNTFIYGLSIRLKPMKKLLTCTVEARMPLADRFANPPANMEYANDYKTLAKYCDEIRIMAYDQQAVDITLNAKKGNGEFYMPVADPEWVEKVIKETLKLVNKNKIVLGVPSYGYEYEVSWENGRATYKRLRSRTYIQAMEHAKNIGAEPFRTSWGELAVLYASTTPISVSKNLTYGMASLTAPKGLFSAPEKVTRFLTISDAKAMADKIALAKKYGLKGVVFFKMDGDIDPAVWKLLK